MKKKFYLLFTTFTLVVLASNLCQAQQTPYTLEYNPDLHLDLGSGLLLDDPFNPKSSPLCSFQRDSSNFGTHGTTYSYYLVSNESSLQHSMGIGGYVTVSGLDYDVNASFHLNSGSFYNSTALTLAISATADCGYISINNEQPCPAADSLCNLGNIQGFRNLYGDNYVTSKDMGVAVTLFLTLSNLDQSTWNSLSTSANGSYGEITGGGVSAGISFNQAMSQANSSHNLQVQIATTANLDFSGLDSLIFAIVSGSSNPVNDIQNAFAIALTQQFDCSKAVPIKYHYRAYPCSDNSSVENPCRLTRMTELYNEYYRIKTKLALLNKILTSQYYTDFHNNADAAEATRLLAQYTADMNYIRDEYILAKADTGCTSCFTSPRPNDALINKFLHLPFIDCMQSNPFAFQYGGNGHFVFTSTREITAAEGADFYNCTSTNAALAGKKITVNFSGTVGCGSYANPTLYLYLRSTLYPVSANNWLFNGGPGDRGFVFSDTIRTGTDGMVNIELWYAGGQNTCPNLTLRTGARFEMIVENFAPDIDAIITPSDSTICQGGSVTLTASSCGGCTYLWSTTATTQSILVNQAGNYFVKLTDSTGNSSTSYWSTITVNQPPVTPTITTSNGTEVVCQGGSTTLTATAPNCKSYTYTWLPSHHVSSTLNVTSAGTYTVVTSNGCGVDDSSSVNITQVQPPSIPIVTMYAPCLLRTPAVSGASYQWYLNDVAIPGDTTRYCTATNIGNYTVRITDVNGCFSVSTDTFFTCPDGINELATAHQVNIYPNPASTQLFIETNGTLVEEINIYNTTGSLVMQTKQPQTNSIDISQLATGVYVAEIKTKEASVMRRWVKM